MAVRAGESRSDRADPVDVAVGQRIRIRRKSLKVSQTALAEALGLSFQQVQKYESGANRVSASMLVAVARILKTSVGDLVGETAASMSDPALAAQLSTPGAVELVTRFAGLTDPKLRSAVLKLLRNLSETVDDEG